MSFLRIIFIIVAFVFVFFIYKAIIYISKYFSSKRNRNNTNINNNNKVKNNITKTSNNNQLNKNNSIENKNKIISSKKSSINALCESKYVVKKTSNIKSFYDYITNDEFYSEFCKKGIENKEIEKPYYKATSPYIVQKSVTKRVEQILQPKNGYIPIRLFKVNQLQDNLQTVNYETPEESRLLSPYLGSVVDYVSRYLYTGNLYSSFYTTIYGIKSYMCFDGGSYPSLSKLNLEDLIVLYQDFKVKINSIKNIKFNDYSKNNLDIIRNIFTLVQADNVLWSVEEPYGMFQKFNNKYEFVFKGNYEIPEYVCKNALISIQRTVHFYKSLKNIRFMEVFTNSELITHSDCDFISHDTIWDLKVSSLDIYNNSRVKSWTLQILIYYLMIKDRNHHNYSKYTSVKNIGIFNPFTNTSYTLNIDSLINEPFIQEIKDEIIGFNWKPEYGLRIDKPSAIKRMKDLLETNDLKIEIYSKSFK